MFEEIFYRSHLTVVNRILYLVDAQFVPVLPSEKGKRWAVDPNTLSPGTFRECLNAVVTENADQPFRYNLFLTRAELESSEAQAIFVFAQNDGRF